MKRAILIQPGTVALLLMHDRGWWHTGHTSLTDNFQPWLGKGQTK